MRLNLPFKPDPFIVALVSAVILASFFPCRGIVAQAFGALTNFAIALLFFLHGAKLSREAILGGIGNWRLHLTVMAASFILFPLLGLALRALGQGIVSAPLLDGLLFLCLLPSTVQSSIAFTAIARGNIPAAVCSASASNVLGMGLTPVLVSVLLGALQQAGANNSHALHAIGQIAIQLLAPFIVGHLLRLRMIDFLTRYKSIVGLVDRGSIVLVVYTAFSAAIVEGLWSLVSVQDLALVAVLGAILLALMLAITTFAARRLGFDRADEIAIVFCGSKKSLASGVPIAGAFFPAASIGAMILPLMLFHQMQLMVCAVLARRYAQRPLT